MTVKQNNFLRAAKWCAYQERAHSEVRDKLYEWEVPGREVEIIIATLIEENYLNEERFVTAFVSGKFNIKKWGKVKIRQGLKLKKISDKMIKTALDGIDGDAYLQTLADQAEKKKRTINEKDPVKLKYKLAMFLRSRGFENDLIFDVLNANNL